MAEATISHLIQTMQENSDNSDKLQRSNRYQLKKIAGLTKNFIDGFDNFHVSWFDRTASKKDEDARNNRDSGMLMQDGLNDVTASINAMAQKSAKDHEEQKKQWLMSGRNSKIMRALTFGMSEKDKGGAAAEKAKEAARAQQKTLEYLKSTSENTGGLLKSFMDSLKEKGKFGILALVTVVAAGIMAVVEFFKNLAIQVRWMKTITGAGLSKIFNPMATFFRNIIGGLKKTKFVQMSSKALSNFFGPVASFFRNLGMVIRKSRWVSRIADISARMGKLFTTIGNFFRPMVKFADIFKEGGKLAMRLIDASTQASKIVKWAGTFGKVLGKVFLPITILMSAWDAITGALDGWEEEGKKTDSNIVTQLVAAIGGGAAKLISNLVGIPMKWIGLAIGWLAEKMGFDGAGKEISDFANKIPEYLSDLIKAPFNFINDFIKFVVDLFENPKQTLRGLLEKLPFGKKIADFILGEDEAPTDYKSARDKMKDNQERLTELDRGIAKGTGLNSDLGGLNAYASAEEVEAAKLERQRIIKEDEEFRAKYADQLRAEALSRSGGSGGGGPGGGNNTQVVDAKRSVKNINVGDKLLDDPHATSYYMNKEAYAL